LIVMQIDCKFISHKTAKYCCLNYHYAKTIPVGKLVKIGVWENTKFIGCVIFGRGANKSLGSKYKLGQTEVCELVRVALTSHNVNVTKIIKISIAMLKKTNRGIKLIVSFADTEQNHEGVIYKAGNWIYAGMTNSADEYMYKGKRWHGRAFRKSKGSHLNYIDKGLKIVKGSKKHRFLMPLNKITRGLIEEQQIPSADGGASPTSTLQTNIEVAQ